MLMRIQVENIKCGGCAASIQKGLLSEQGVDAVEVDVEQGMVSITGNSAEREQLTAALLKMGYPETGTAEGIAAAKAKAKSFVSCAIGKVDNMVKR